MHSLSVTVYHLKLLNKYPILFYAPFFLMEAVLSVSKNNRVRLSQTKGIDLGWFL